MESGRLVRRLRQYIRMALIRVIEVGSGGFKKDL